MYRTKSVFVLLFCTILNMSAAKNCASRAMVTAFSSTRTGSMQAPFYTFLQTARHSLCMNIYTLRDKNLLMLLVLLQKQKVNVDIVVDQHSIKHDQGILKRLQFYKLPYAVYYGVGTSINHNKYVVVDGKRVWLGSMNFTQCGYSGHLESAVIISNPNIARFYQKDFKNTKQLIQSQQETITQENKHQVEKYKTEIKAFQKQLQKGLLYTKV